ncbi:MAG: nitrophenyl compound nitroreductase subunit ArsF family protein [Bacteroidetes bacterium]|nr:nitrophenyl compound nitroreductase subunit ArsF family protein [Bacteroidota bacterium]
MKTSFRFLMVLVLTATVSFAGAQTKTPVKTQPKVEVYYFHPDDRCPIDQSIESNTVKVMQSDFAKQVKDGTILFRVINTDDKSAANIVSKFDINAQALYIVKIDKGKEIQKDLTKFAFDFGQSNPGKFKAGLIDEINKALK